MQDLTIIIQNECGALAALGEALGRAEVNIEGGGIFAINDKAIGHFLFEDGAKAKLALEREGVKVSRCSDVLILRLDQGQPGQLGKISRRLSNAGVNMDVVYSDHQNQLILVVDNLETGRVISEKWTRDQASRSAREDNPYPPSKP